jgi:hypothetical protein
LLFGSADPMRWLTVVDFWSALRKGTNLMCEWYIPKSLMSTNTSIYLMDYGCSRASWQRSSSGSLANHAGRCAGFLLCPMWGQYKSARELDRLAYYSLML